MGKKKGDFVLLDLSDAQLYKQAGNSVNVHAVETIAKQLKIILCKLQHNF
jgi:site-specific DNA-cytosine methylase